MLRQHGHLTRQYTHGALDDSQVLHAILGALVRVRTADTIISATDRLHVSSSAVVVVGRKLLLGLRHTALQV